MSHLGRPKGKVVEELRLDPVAERLSELLGVEVRKLDECVGPDVEAVAKGLNEGEVVLLENLRFDAAEEKQGEEFSRQLANLGEVYVNDAFGTAHRAHSSTVGVTKYLHSCAAGYLMEKELRNLGKLTDDPEKPFVAIIGGAKISGKIEVIQNLLNVVNKLVIGGAMAYTFFRSQGANIGDSLVEEDLVDVAHGILETAEAKGVPLILPVDTVIAQELKEGVETDVVMKGNIPEGWQGLDIGPLSIETIKAELSQARTVLWNGPLGAFEVPPFDTGTNSIAKMLAASDMVTIIGGGDSVAAVTKLGLQDKMSHICTGGGASLEFLEGKKLPGVEALTEKR